jgi:ribulose-5-phosphate 4-epimerase/fuculose-1-phosphate aldolase
MDRPFAEGLVEGNMAVIKSMAKQIDDDERHARVQVAAGYRLVAMYGMSDLTDGFVGGRIGSTRDFVIGGYGLLPELATASILHRRSLDRPAELEKFVGVDIDAINFTQTALATRPEFNACIHAHTDFGVTFSALDIDLLPMSQFGIMFHGKLGHVDFEDTQVTSGAACAAIADRLTHGAEIVVLRNHGFLCPGRSVAQAFFNLYRIEQACRVQLRAMMSGAKIRLPPSDRLAEIRDQYWTQTNVDNDGNREWDSLLAKLDRLDPEFRV